MEQPTLKRDCTGNTFPSVFCSLCARMPTNHYCVFPDTNSMISNLLKEVADCSYLHKVIKSGLRNDLMEVLLAFKGLSIDSELKKPHHVTGLYPFMTAAVSNKKPLNFVYKLAMLDPTVIMKEAVQVIRKGSKRGREENDD